MAAFFAAPLQHHDDALALAKARDLQCVADRPIRRARFSNDRPWRVRRARDEADAWPAPEPETDGMLMLAVGGEPVRYVDRDMEAALDALAKAQAVAATELRRAASDLNVAAERVQRYDTSLLDAAGRSAQAAEFAFQRGAISVLEVLDARRTLRAVRLEALAARNDYAKALAAWRSSIATATSLAPK
jgi:hypothetical protein